MTYNVKFMLLGIFLAVMSVGGFVLADEEEIFFIIAVALPVAAIWAFMKGFYGSDKEEPPSEHKQPSPTLIPEQSQNPE